MRQEKIHQFEDLLRNFSNYIRMNIQKFHPQKNGLDPDDIFQEVKIKLWRILNDEKRIGNYSSYIKKIVDSTVIDHIRRCRREKGIFLLEKQKKISETKGRYEDERSQSRPLYDKIGEVVESLIESRKKVVKLYLLNLTIEEISILFDWSKDKTRNLLYRGLADIKRKLRETGIEYED